MTELSFEEIEEIKSYIVREVEMDMLMHLLLVLGIVAVICLAYLAGKWSL